MCFKIQLFDIIAIFWFRICFSFWGVVSKLLHLKIVHCKWVYGLVAVIKTRLFFHWIRRNKFMISVTRTILRNNSWDTMEGFSSQHIWTLDTCLLVTNSQFVFNIFCQLHAEKGTQKEKYNNWEMQKLINRENEKLKIHILFSTAAL